MEEKGVNNRIVEIMRDEGLSKNAFAHKLGVSQTAISQIELNKNFPSFKIIIEVLKNYPRINSDWLLLGIGPKNRQEYKGGGGPISTANEPAGVYAAGDQGLLREVLAAMQSKSEETEKLLDVIKGQAEEMTRYGERFDRILNLLDKLYGVKFIEPEK